MGPTLFESIGVKMRKEMQELPPCHQYAEKIKKK